MRINVNGTCRDMTTEEIEEMKKAQAEMTDQEPTQDERLRKVEQRTADMESGNAEILEALDMLLSGVTE